MVISILRITGWCKKHKQKRPHTW